jgi:hypothetical protein
VADPPKADDRPRRQLEHYSFKLGSLTGGGKVLGHRI